MPSDVTIETLFGGQHMIIIERLCEDGSWHRYGERVFNSTEDAFNYIQTQPNNHLLRWHII